MSLAIDVPYGRPVCGAGDRTISICTDQLENKTHDIQLTDSVSIPAEVLEKFRPMINKKTERAVLYVAGPSGSGKSTYVANYLKEYRKAFPSRKIYMLSALTSDPSLACIPEIKCLKIDDTLISNPLKAEEFKNSCVIADDIDCLTNKKHRLACLAIVGEILELGRHFNTTLIQTSHLTTAGLDSRRILNEAHYITYFPHSGSVSGIKRLLLQYCGLSNADLEEAKSTGSRWITICKNFPIVLFGEKVCWQPKN